MSSGASLIYRFAGFELDPGRFELRDHGAPVHVEPQVLSLLILLAGNADRLVSKDEMIEKVWGGRFISDAAVASRIKAARKALGDDGDRQIFIRTVHGKGFRFHAPVEFDLGREAMPAAPRQAEGAAALETPPDRRPAIAVLPFRLAGEPGPLAFAADALADELIADLARLRWLLVIARASSFRFRDREASCADVGATLNVGYCLSGTLEESGQELILSVSLARTSDSGIIWAERYRAGRDELQDVKRETLKAIAANLEARIVQNEIELARRTPDTALGAWGAYHLGLDHMFRFNKADNDRAAALFAKALASDPNFSRAYSGLSFTAFQDAFLQYSGTPEHKAEQARSLAEQALRYDPMDPFAHLNLGRSLWMDGALAESVDRLSECIALSPNYAQAIYSKAWAEMAQCDGRSSDADALLALRLSPLDPLRYAMLAVRSVSALLQGDLARAADLGERAARSPGAHKHIAVIAAVATQMSGQSERAASWVGRAKELDASVSPATFLRSFPFAPSAGRDMIEKALREIRL